MEGLISRGGEIAEVEERDGEEEEAFEDKEDDRLSNKEEEKDELNEGEEDDWNMDKEGLQGEFHAEISLDSTPN